MPNALQIHVDTLLSNVSAKYRNVDYIAMEIFPVLPVKKTSDLYRVYDRNFKLPETARANRGVAREHEFEVSTASYKLDWHALKSYVSDQDKDNYDLADLLAETTEELTDVVLRRVEKSTADLFTSTNWSLGVSLASGANFNSNTTTTNPIPVFDTGASTIVANSGKMPNYGFVPRDAFVAIKNHVSVLDRTKYVSAEMDVKMIQALLGLKQLLVPLASIDTAAPGQAASISNIYPDVGFLGWKPDSPGPLTPSAGYMLKKNRSVVKRWRDEERESDVVEVNMEFQPKIVSSLCGYLIKDLIQ